MHGEMGSIPTDFTAAPVHRSSLSTYIPPAIGKESIDWRSGVWGAFVGAQILVRRYLEGVRWWFFGELNLMPKKEKMRWRQSPCEKICRCDPISKSVAKLSF